MVAGDIMLDTYHFGKVGRISPEAPVPVFLEMGDIRHVPGGAANVAVNLAAAGVATELFSVAGQDEAGDLLLRLLGGAGVGTRLAFRDGGRRTTCKMRYIGQNHQQILRVDTEDAVGLPAGLAQGPLAEIREGAGSYGLILISDYGKGFLGGGLAQELIALGGEWRVPVVVDVKGMDCRKYRGAYLLKPNREELAALTGMPVATDREVGEAARSLCRAASCRYVLATLGAGGMLLADADGVAMRARSVAKEVYDVTGAGDTSAAYLAAGLLAGEGITRAVELANYAAGVQVSKVGTSVVYPGEVGQAMAAGGCARQGKELDYYRPGGLGRLEREKALGRKVVFTNGCFDILHAGHVSCLEQAKAMGDVLVVGVNSDQLVRRLKGEGRPVNPLRDRLAVLSALGCVDYVVAFREDTPSGLVEAVGPDVLVKGGDYLPGEIAGAGYVESHNGTVATVPLVPGRSTTAVIGRLKG